MKTKDMSDAEVMEAAWFALNHCRPKEDCGSEVQFRFNLARKSLAEKLDKPEPTPWWPSLDGGSKTSLRDAAALAALPEVMRSAYAHNERQRAKYVNDASLAAFHTVEFDEMVAKAFVVADAFIKERAK